MAASYTIFPTTFFPKSIRIKIHDEGSGFTDQGQGVKNMTKGWIGSRKRMNDYDLAQTLSPSLCPPPLLPLTATTFPHTTTRFRSEVVKTLAPGNINHGQCPVPWCCNLCNISFMVFPLKSSGLTQKFSPKNWEACDAKRCHHQSLGNCLIL